MAHFLRSLFGGIFACAEEVTTFDEVTLHLSGMRAIQDYAILNKGAQTEVCEYGNEVEDGKRVKKVIKCVSVDTETVLKVLNDCHIMAWDGFHGKHPRGIKDGTMFRFTAQVNDGQSISAHGSQNFPRNFQKFRDWIRSTLES